MTTLIRPTLHRHHDFTGNDNPHMILSTDEVEEALEKLDQADPDSNEKTKSLLSRIVPVDSITARWLVGPVDMEPAPTYDPIDAKYAHFERMVAGVITTVEYDTISARIDEECATTQAA